MVLGRECRGRNVAFQRWPGCDGVFSHPQRSKNQFFAHIGTRTLARIPALLGRSEVGRIATLVLCHGIRRGHSQGTPQGCYDRIIQFVEPEWINTYLTNPALGCNTEAEIAHAGALSLGSDASATVLMVVMIVNKSCKVGIHAQQRHYTSN